jgi:hypothetical protein
MVNFTQSYFALAHHSSSEVEGMNCFARSNAGDVDSNPTPGMDIRVCLSCVWADVCVVAALRRTDLHQESPTDCS